MQHSIFVSFNWYNFLLNVVFIHVHEKNIRRRNLKNIAPQTYFAKLFKQNTASMYISDFKYYILHTEGFKLHNFFKQAVMLRDTLNIICCISNVNCFRSMVYIGYLFNLLKQIRVSIFIDSAMVQIMVSCRQEHTVVVDNNVFLKSASFFQYKIEMHTT